MRLKFYSVENLKKQILEIIGKYLDLNCYKVFFFGSRVSGKGDERSDIDIGIEGPKPIPTKIMGKIEEEIEQLPILYKIDVVDFKKVSPKFKKVAKEKIEMLN